MLSGWVAAGIATLVAGASFLRMIWVGGRRDGKIDAILERLTDGQEDHEKRLRLIELSQARRR